MRIKTQDYHDITVIELQGELSDDITGLLKKTVSDFVQTPLEKDEVDDKKMKVKRNGIVLDMSNVNYIDSEGLEALLWIRDFCNDSNCQLRLAGLDENCDKILEITRLHNQFNCYSELTEAVKSFA